MIPARPNVDEPYHLNRRRIAILPLRCKLYCENTDLLFAIKTGLFSFLSKAGNSDSRNDEFGKRRQFYLPVKLRNRMGPKITACLSPRF